jgi:preprotein translocase subunit YajC
LEYLNTFWPFLLIIAVFYFLMIRRRIRKKKQLTQMRNEVSLGDRIITIGRDHRRCRQHEGMIRW